MGLAAVPSGVATAQAHAWLRGRVTQADGGGIVGARVRAGGAAGPAVSVRTDSSGRYGVEVVPGRYAVAVDAPGFRGATRVVDLAPGMAASSDFVLAAEIVSLPALSVRVPRLSVARATRWTPGTVDPSESAIALVNEPRGDGGLSDFLFRIPGVATTPDGGISLGGESPAQTRATMDGAPVESGGVPRDAVASVAVLTNTYDVGRGQFTGGQVEVQTLRAGNPWGATLRVSGRDPRLQYGDAPPGLRWRSSSASVDATGGGAIARDRVFLFGAFSGQRSASPPVSVADAGAAADLDPAGLQRFLQLSAPLAPRPSTADGREAGSATGLLRLDATLSARHELMVRVDGGSQRRRDGGDPYALAGTGTEQLGSRGGVLVQLNSGGAHVANAFRASAELASERWSAADPVPRGVVDVPTAAEGGADGVAQLRFAGSAFLPPSLARRSVELNDQVVRTTADGTHRFRLGAEAAAETRDLRARAGQATFYFSSLDALEAGEPTLFTRAPDLPRRTARSGRAAVFADDHWRIGTASVSYGIRAERTWYGTGDGIARAPIDGRVPGVVPSRWHVSPRVGFAFKAKLPWDRRTQGSTQFQGGIGEFVGALPLAVLGNALFDTGSPAAAGEWCAGAAAPVSDWPSYRTHGAGGAIACADAPGAEASRLPDATLFAPSFGAPRTWRGSLGAMGVWRNMTVWNVNASLARGVAQPLAFDRNLADVAFTLPGEGDRPVYAPAGAIDPATGLVSPAASRRDPSLRSVREVTNGGRSRAAQLSAWASRLFTRVPVIRSGRIDLGYTWTASSVTVGPLPAPGAPPPSTAGDARRADWTAAPYAPRHAVFGVLSTRPSPWVTLSTVVRVASGLPYAPLVAGDVNGDGVENDRAFVFDPAAGGDARVAEGMSRLLDAAPGPARDCLRAQLGRVASPDGCRTPWSASVDLRASFEVGPRAAHTTDRRLRLWVSARNVASGLDYLLHGPDRLRGWGQPQAVDNTLLVVRGFDEASRAFRYEVNPRFGEPRARSFARRVPFGLTLEGRLALGTDHVRAAFTRSTQAGSDRGRSLEPANLRRFVALQVPVLPAEVLERNGSLALELAPSQAAELQAAADDLSPRAAALTDSLATEVRAAYTASDVRVHRARVRALCQSVLELRAEGERRARAVLLPDQWARLPARLRAAATCDPYPPERVEIGN